ncbi:MAG: helix-turn-helix domain-containing protein [Lachnospiraceae bacterium]|nr:helix-turn-helix domain-containing protein [Lachnospiraceae bacterium]
MNITLNIILESLGLRADKEIGSREFTRVLLLNEKTKKNFNTNYLYIAEAEQAYYYSVAESEAFFMCIKNDEDDFKRKNLVCVDFDGDLVELLFKVQNEFFRIGEWSREMHMSLLNGKGLNDLLRLSEPILKNSIIITDSGFSLVANTKGIEPKDPIVKKLIQKGYHDTDAIELLGGNESLHAWTEINDVGVVEISKVAKSAMVYKIHRFEYSYYNHTVMMCDHVGLTPGLMDLFNMLAENLSIAIEANWNAEKHESGHRSSLFEALIDQYLSDGRTLDSIASEAGVPLNGNFLFIEVIPKPVSKVPLARMTRELSELFPNALTAVHHGIPMMILYNRNDSELFTESFEERLNHFASKNDCICGISEPYSDLTDTRNAYKQVNLTLRFGNAVKPGVLGPLAPVEPGDKKVLTFSDNSMYYLLSDMSDSHIEMLRKSKYGKLVTKLLQHENGTQAPYLSILYTYLSCERNATLAGRHLHMHRNNILYHIAKIEDMLGVDLEDAHVRFQLLAACTILTVS